MPSHQQSGLSLQTDLVFKAVFGRDTSESKELLIDLLNTILNRSKHDKIQSIIHKNPFILQPHINAKEIILDIKAETDSGELVDIEMQMNYTNLYRNRSLYYWSRLHSEQLADGEGFKHVKQSISIHIVSEKCFKESAKNHLTFYVLEKDEFFLLCKDLEIHYVQLPLFDDTIEVESMDKMTEWMTLLKDIHLPAKQPIIKKILLKEGVMQLAYDEYSKITADDLLKEQLEARQKFIWDMNTEKEFAIEEGLKRGLEQGIEQGIEQGLQLGIEQEKIKIAKNLKDNHVDINIIISASGLSKEEIDKL